MSSWFALRTPLRQPVGPASRSITTGIALASAAAATILVLYRTPAGRPVLVVAFGVAIVLIGWLFLSEHYERTLLVVILYIGLLDGFLRLKTGSSNLTLARDALLYAIVAGGLIRGIIRRNL